MYIFLIFYILCSYLYFYYFVFVVFFYFVFIFFIYYFSLSQKTLGDGSIGRHQASIKVVMATE